MAKLAEQLETLTEELDSKNKEIKNLKSFLDMANEESARMSMQHDIDKKRMNDVVNIAYNLLTSTNSTLELAKGNLDQLIAKINQDRGGYNG